MAQSGFTPIKLYLSTTPAAVPTAGNLEPGELALNNADGKLFYEDSAGVVQVIATQAGASGTVTSVGGTGTVNGITLTGTVTSSGNLTLGGTLSGVNLTTQVTGTLPATNGGTGQSSYAVGDLVFASTTTALSKLADVATGNALISGGVGVAPAYGKIGLTTHVSGTLPVANGGTGVASTTEYALVAGGTTPTGSLQQVSGVGTSGQVLVSNGASALPSWQAPPASGLTQAQVTAYTMTLGF